MRNILRLKRNYSILFLLGLVLAFMLLSPDIKIEATSKTKDSKQNICGEHLELAWSKALFPPSSPKIKRGPIAMQVLPSGENYMVHTVISEGGESSDVPRDIDTFLLDTNGNVIWRRRYIDLPLVFSQGHAVSVGKQTYRYFDRLLYGGGDVGLRYHVWLDEKGFVQWIYAQRERFNIETFSQEWKEVEIVNDVVYNLVAKCQAGICQVDSLKISEKGVDPKGWQTILKWPYPEDNKDKVVYQPVSVSTSYLLVYKKEPKGVDAVEFHLIQFSPDGNRQIKYDSKYYFPYKSEEAFIKNKDGSFIFFLVQEKKGTFIRLDKTGKQIETKIYNLPEKFKTWIGAIKPFKDGWLISGWPETNDKKSGFIFTRLSSDGKPLQSIKWFNELAGNDEENLFLSYDGTLYKCREKQEIKGK